MDCEASAGWLPVDVREFGAAMVSFSPHRYGPKGVGVLYRNKKARLVSVIHGGVPGGRTPRRDGEHSSDRRRRSGGRDFP